MIVRLIHTAKPQKNDIDYCELIYEICATGLRDSGEDEDMYILLQTMIKAGVRKIIFNMNKMDFIDSKGIKVLINAAKVIRKSEGDIILIEIPDRIKTIFKPIDLQRFMKMFETREEAEKELKKL